MEKETLIQSLKDKVGEDNRKVISDRTFAGIAESFLPMFAEDEKITDDTWKMPLAALNEFAGQKRFDEKEFAEKFKTDYATQHEKDVAERIRKATEDAVSKAIEDYKKEHPETKEKGGEAEQDDIDAKIAAAVAKAMEGVTGKESALGKSIDTLTNFIATQTEREKTDIKNRVKAELKQHLVKMQANNEACVDDALDDIDYGEKPTFDGLKQKAIDAYEARYKRYYANGGKPFGGDSTGGGGENSFVKEKLEQLKKEAKESQDYAQTLAGGFM